MSANNEGFRLTPTEQFQRTGLGYSLTAAFERMTEFARRDNLDHDEQWGAFSRIARSYAVGILVERITWAADGLYIGMFDETDAMSASERDEFTNLVNESDGVGLPQAGWNYRNLFEPQSERIDKNFVFQNFRAQPLNRPVIEWFPVYRAVSIVCEMLSGDAITAFFLYLRLEEPNDLFAVRPNPERLMTALRESDSEDHIVHGMHSAETVLAGLIRYLEFLSAMEGIFPDLDLSQPLESGTSDDRYLDRHILLYAVRPYQWRFPPGEKAFQAFMTALSALMKVGEEEFAHYPDTAMHWSQEEAFMRAFQLTLKFFRIPEQTDDETSEGEDETSAENRRNRVKEIRSRMESLTQEPPEEERYLTM